MKKKIRSLARGKEMPRPDLRVCTRGGDTFTPALGAGKEEQTSHLDLLLERKTSGKS